MDAAGELSSSEVLVLVEVGWHAIWTLNWLMEL